MQSFAAEADGSSNAAVDSPAPASSEAAAAASAADASTDAAADAQNNAAEEGKPNITLSATDSEIEIVSGQMTLTSEDAPAVALIQQDGLNFIDNGDGTATMVGWSGKAPEGDLNVPSQVAGLTVSTIDFLATSTISEELEALKAEAEMTEAAARVYASDAVAAAGTADEVARMGIPATIDTINVASFAAFPGLTSITVAADNQTYSSYNGMLFDEQLSSLLLIPEGMEGVAVLPESLASVPACVITRCTKLLGLDIPTGGAASAAFTAQNGMLYLNNLTPSGTPDGTLTLLAAPMGIGASAMLDASCTSIVEGAFWGNADLQTIVAQGTVRAIEAGEYIALSDEDALAPQVTMEDGTEAIYTTIPAFGQDTVKAATVVCRTEEQTQVFRLVGFVNFKMPPEVGTQVTPAEGSGFAFTLLPNYTLSVAWVGEDEPAADMQVPDYGIVDGAQYAVATIADKAFAGREMVTATLPATITAIGDAAFEGCTELRQVNWPNNVVYLGDRVLAGTGLASAVLPTQLTTVGAQAFADLDGTTIVVTSKATDDVAPDALADCRNTVVYVPFQADDDYAWHTGLPTTGNHLYPYGARLSDEVYDISVGDTVELFGNGGYLHAPGDIQVNYSYKAKSMSIDADAGTVTGKQAGNSTVGISLTLTVDEAAVEGAQPNEIKLHLAKYGDAGTAPVEKPASGIIRATHRLTTAADDTMKTFEVRVVDAPQICVAVPMRAVFDRAIDSTDGYDITTAVADLPASCYFENRSPEGTALELVSIKCVSKSATLPAGSPSGTPVIESILETSDSTALANKADLFSLQRTDSSTAKVDFGYGDATGMRDGITGFTVPGAPSVSDPTRLEVKFLLNMASAHAQLTEAFKQGIDAHATEHDLATVTYTFKAATATS